MHQKLLLACRKGDKRAVDACLSDPDRRADVNATAPAAGVSQAQACHAAQVKENCTVEVEKDESLML